jgi:hypothetical protein
MKRIVFGCVMTAASALLAAAKEPVDWVDPTIETNKGRWFFCTPGSRPFGMVVRHRTR